MKDEWGDGRTSGKQRLEADARNGLTGVEMVPMQATHTRGRRICSPSALQPALPPTEKRQEKKWARWLTPGRQDTVWDDCIDCLLMAAASWEEDVLAWTDKFFKISSISVNLYPQKTDRSRGAHGDGQETKFHSRINSRLPFSFQSSSKISTGRVFADNNLPSNSVVDLWKVHWRTESLWLHPPTTLGTLRAATTGILESSCSVKFNPWLNTGFKKSSPLI